MESRNAIKKRVFLVLFAFGAYGAVLFVVYSLRFGVNLDLLMADPGAFLGQEYVSDPLKEYYFNFLMFFVILSMSHFVLFFVSVYCFVFPSLYLFFSIFCTLVYFCDYLPGCSWRYFRASVLLALGRGLRRLSVGYPPERDSLYPDLGRIRRFEPSRVLGGCAHPVARGLAAEGPVAKAWRPATGLRPDFRWRADRNRAKIERQG
ncbi:MAG: hypothetical protein NXI16_06900 [Alphaproteobacteria bacterium]|nr:hypothetical protein [Alphaproteobacteria bacterium]